MRIHSQNMFETVPKKRKQPIRKKYVADLEMEKLTTKNSPKKNKPTCAMVAAMTSVAHNKNKQYTFNAKVDFTLLLPYA